jgi:hypothetical protein
MVVGRDLSRANRGRRVAKAARPSRAHAGNRPHRPNSSEISRNWIESPAGARRRAPLV